MNNNDVTTVIDETLCTGCGLCAEVCPAGTLAMVGDKAKVVGTRSIQCGQCEAVCPTRAIKVEALDPKAFAFATIAQDDGVTRPGQFDLPQLVRLMRSRRSCRKYLDKPVALEQLEDLVRIGTSAPSGTNSQLWTFTILPSRKAVMRLGEEVAGFFGDLNRKAEKAWLRRLLKLVGQPQLDQYYRGYYRTIEKFLKEWRNSGRDRLFHGAPTAILVGCKPGATTPSDDALLATQNILLAAHAMGLSSCLIGFAVAAMRKDPGILQKTGIPRDETVYSVIALGYSDREFLRPAGRRKAEVRVLQD